MIEVSTHNHGNTVTIRVSDSDHFNGSPTYVTVSHASLEALAEAVTKAAQGNYTEDQTV